MDEGEAQGGRLPKMPTRRKKGRRRSRKTEPEGQSNIPPAETGDYRRRMLLTAPHTIQTQSISHMRRILNASTPRTCHVRDLMIWVTNAPQH